MYPLKQRDEMFEINEVDLPLLRTRRALLVLDLQKNLVAPGGITPVEQPPNLADDIAKLVPIFRQTGTIIWIKSEFEGCRPVNDGTNQCENVITNKEVISIGQQHQSQPIQPMQNSKRLQEIARNIMERDGSDTEAADLPQSNGPSLMEADEGHPSNTPEEEVSEQNEAFLSPPPGEEPGSLRPGTSDSDLIEALQNVVNPSEDLFFTKSHYSAFGSGLLLQILRSQFVTELFICGALTNMSVFATAMDAARYGYAITLVDDCLGYRSKSRHDQALRSLDEATGCDMFSSLEVIDEIEKKTKPSIKNEKAISKRPVRQNLESEGIDQMMEKLKLRSGTNVTSLTEGNPTKADQKNSKAPSPSLKPEGSLTSNGSGLSDEMLPQLRRPTEATAKNRVPNKIKVRRRTSKPPQPDPSTTTSDNNPKADSKPSKTSVSPQPSIVISASEGPKKTQTKVSRDEPKDSQTVREKPAELNGQGGETTSQKSIASSAMPTSKLIPTSSTPETKASSKTSEQQQISVDGETPLLSIEGEPICEGDTVVISNLLPNKEAVGIFERIKTEVQWQRMSHQGGEVPRLVAVQGEIGSDGSFPIYRHPADESPPLLEFSPTVSLVRREVESKLGHPVNHCLIQFYRSGTDYISEHSDKTLDIVPDTYIANVSLGAQRTMTFRTKRPLKDGKPVQTGEENPRSTCRTSLPHNSLCRMGLMTNMHWLHSIRQDKRLDRDKSQDELDYNGVRISLTFRQIGTFLNKDQSKIWGQGAVAKHKKHARRVLNGPSAESKKMIEAFGHENRSSDFDWPEVYGHGFDVLHMSNARKLLLSGNQVVDMRVMVFLTHLGLEWSPSNLSTPINLEPGMSVEPVMRLVDTDASRSTVEGCAAILLYLDMVYGSARYTRSSLQYARLFTRLHQAIDLKCTPLDPRALEIWETYAAEDSFIASSKPSIVDFAFWPMLHSIVKDLPNKSEFPQLKAYYRRMADLDSVKKTIATVEEGEGNASKD